MKIKKNNPKTYTILVALLALTMLSNKCGKDPTPEPAEPQLPPATQTGANTFGCYLNGELYVPNGNAFYPSMDEPKYYQNEGRFLMRTRNLYDFTHNIYIYIYIKNGAHQTDIYPGYEDDTHPCLTNNGYEYYLDTTLNHSVEITRLDITNKIFSGLFEFTCFNETVQDTIKITEGRFDLKNVIINP